MAPDFDRTRSAAWPGWSRVLDAIDVRQPRVLDVGCGNARFAASLAARFPRFDYRGIDASEALLARARSAFADDERVQLELGDFVARTPDEALPKHRFDLVCAFGVMHHVPGHSERKSLLGALASRLGRSGLLAIAFWRFGEFERFRERALPWTAAPALDTQQLESGDLLLGWGSGDAPPRYCHFADAEERAGLLAGLDLEPVDEFDADGRSGNLNHYALLRAHS